LFVFALDYRNFAFSLILFLFTTGGDVCQPWLVQREPTAEKPLLCSSSRSSILYCHINELTLLTHLNNNNQASKRAMYLALETISIPLITICVLRAKKKA